MSWSQRLGWKDEFAHLSDQEVLGEAGKAHHAVKQLDLARVVVCARNQLDRVEVRRQLTAFLVLEALADDLPFINL